MKTYRVSLCSSDYCPIDVMDIVKRTGKSVVFLREKLRWDKDAPVAYEESRELIYAEHHRHFETLDEAVNFSIKRCENKINKAQTEIEKHSARIVELRKLLEG